MSAKPPSRSPLSPDRRRRFGVRALIGAALAAFFCATTVWSMLYTVGKGATTMGAVVMGSWLAKMVVLIVVLVIITQFDFYDRVVLFVVLLLGAVGSALLDYRAVRNGRVPYVETDTTP